MKELGLSLVLLVTATMLGGCGYAGVATAGDKVIVTRNDLLLFGAMRRVYVCDVTDEGLTDCERDERP